MAIIVVTGVVTKIGPSVARGKYLVLEHIEITKPRGVTMRLEFVSAVHPVAKTLELDAIGTFYFRRIGFRRIRPTHRIWGVERADGIRGFDPDELKVEEVRSFIEDS